VVYLSITHRDQTPKELIEHDEAIAARHRAEHAHHHHHSAPLQPAAEES
jgi:hypothetical protein